MNNRCERTTYRCYRRPAVRFCAERTIWHINGIRSAYGFAVFKKTAKEAANYYAFSSRAIRTYTSRNHHAHFMRKRGSGDDARWAIQTLLWRIRRRRNLKIIGTKRATPGEREPQKNLDCPLKTMGIRLRRRRRCGYTYCVRVNG